MPIPFVDGSRILGGKPASLADVEDEETTIPYKEDYSPDVLGRDLVREWMNPDVITVGLDTSLIELCRVMTSTTFK